MALANTQIAAEIAERDRWHYIDWFAAMLDQQGRPDGRFFTDDLVHLNDEGYSLLAEHVKEALPRA